MSRSSESRVVWKCPECRRNFRTLRSKPIPDVCVKCAKKSARPGGVATAGSADDEEMYFQEAEAAKAGSLKFGVAVQPAGRPAPPAVGVVSSAGGVVSSAGSAGQSTDRREPSPQAQSTGDGVSVEDLSERLDEVLEHLEGITRTMKLVRWVMWGLGLATILSGVVTLGGLLYSMSLVGSLSDVMNPQGGVMPGGELPEGAVPGVGVPGGGVGGNPGIPGLQKNLQKIGEYNATVQDLLNEHDQ
jgi:hypothetical protein